MDRAQWLRDRRAAVTSAYDLESPFYDADPYPATSHRRFVDRLVAEVPLGGTILDAPCGTGRYFEPITVAGRHVVGIDQSAGMLRQARARGLANRLERVGLQEVAYAAEFDGAMTIDAMENVPPEDWPLVLHNLVQAVRPGAPIYLTIEEISDADIDAAFRANQAAGLPAILGEVVEGETGYHFYPGRGRVRSWLADARLTIVDDATDHEDGWAYRHLLLRVGDRAVAPTQSPSS